MIQNKTIIEKYLVIKIKLYSINDNRALGCGGKLNIKYIINGLITGYKTGYVQVT